ncbi:unnamed protein product [Chrysoparadoxa australica]
MRAVLLDTQGPEIRTGNLVGDTPIMLEKGNTIELHTDASYQDKGTAEAVYVNFTGLTETVHVGSNVLFDDGLISLGVLDVAPGKVTCMIENSGPLKNRRGVNLPGARVQLPPLSEKDKKDICYGIANDIDFVAASFVRKASDVVTIRKFINTQYKKTWPKGEHPPHIISKIENLEAVDNFPDILQESDAIMVARGDLGVELPMEQVTNLQKWMVQECNRVGKPVIVATQMLESMQQNPRPTRAEVSDVTNAVYDGADAVMLSGESAQGDYPVESVYTMRRIVAESEQWKQNHGVAQDGTGSASSKGLERYKDSVRAKAVEVVVVILGGTLMPLLHLLLVLRQPCRWHRRRRGPRLQDPRSRHDTVHHKERSSPTSHSQVPTRGTGYMLLLGLKDWPTADAKPRLAPNYWVGRHK